MILIVAEKPSVARDIARVLKCRGKGDGFIKGDQYMVSWALGHLVSLCEPDELDEKYKKWHMEDLPILPEQIPTKVLPKTRSQFAVLKKLMASPDIDSLICATDAGREGELIFRLIYEKTKCTKPVQRLWISSMTDEAISDGFKSLRPSSDYDGLYQSAQCRSQADWLVGMNLSRVFTLRYHALLSIGRVQTPTLAILVKRYHEIATFKPVDYYVLTADFGDYKGQWFDPKIKDEKVNTRIMQEEEAKKIQQDVHGKAAIVKKVTTEQKREMPPQLYDLTSLQRDANKMLGYTADKTLKIAQSLYEKWKAITYPRTDSRYLPMDMLPRVPATMNKLPQQYQPLLSGIPHKEDGKLFVSKRIFDNEKISDHHALIPTPQTAPLDKMSPDERAVFDLIAKRLIAAFYPAFEYDQTRIITQCEGHSFKSVGRVIRVTGWKSIYQRDESKTRQKADAPDDTPLPALSMGDERIIKKTSVKKGVTEPPPLHNDASLLAAMENAGRDLEDEALREKMKGSGLGTPATRAAIIERLVHVGYAQRKGRSISATEKGVQLIGIVPRELASPEMTGQWELALTEIAQNKRETEGFMNGIRNMTVAMVDYAKSATVSVDFPQEERKKGGKIRPAAVLIPDAVCPLCGKGVVENQKAFGCSAWQDGCHFTLWKDCLTRGGGPLLNEKIVKMLLRDGSVRGSTGTIQIKDGMLSFTPTGRQNPSISVSVQYSKKK